jgi:hypothetical protein
MQSILDHIAAVIRPALRKYLAAEKTLTDALESNDAEAVGRARQDVLLAARHAAIELHHLSDFVFNERVPELSFANLTMVRNAVDARCVFLRTGMPIADASLLRDVADAFKHHRLNRSDATVVVSTDVVPIGSGYGQMRFGEGKYGGGEQVIITTKKRRQARAFICPAKCL